VAAPIFHLPSLYQLFSMLCHQQPARSWHIHGEPLAVCIRCASLYFGFLAGLLVLRTPNLRWLKLAIAATAVEWALALVVLDLAVLRSVTGLLLGGVAAPFVIAGVEQMFGRLAHESV
jgi:uncharacterized membrane protein